MSERYHVPLPQACKRTRTDANHCISDKKYLQLTFFAVKFTVGREGKCPLLLVLAAIPRSAKTLLAPSQM